MITGNKGEWSEIYALFKLLGDKVLQPGDKNIEKIKDIFYPIIKILRSESNGDFEYSINDDIVLIVGNSKELRIPIIEFKQKSISLLNYIKSSSAGTFSIPEIEIFMKSINCISLKASSSSKTDITIVVHDQRTNQQPTLGFSIKSQLGNPSTLLNAGKTTNFTFKINNLILNSSEIAKINFIDSRSKIKDRIEEILNKGGQFEFVETEQKIFSNNLILIDSFLPQILSEIVFDFYNSNHTKTSDLVNELEIKNPLKFDISNKHRFYNYKIKRFLTDTALGMMPSKVWTGKYDSTGGYLIIKEDGEILCYHIYNQNEFEDYLINNTKLETASSTRHKFGELFEENGELFFKLNLQIRFIK
ncbi:MAG: HpaII family restriction endonuclease [Bacteroidetes bacterium HGW-Bacteroidetes-12]|nr:MAG: HpaII family restriction endonuclease [Bacteroidetes bacterium HGW-Bacteroidetes-12]